MRFLSSTPPLVNTQPSHQPLKSLALLLVISHATLIIHALGGIVDHVTCGSVVKLSNEANPLVRLHSHDIKYGSGSGQQSVTGAENQDTNSYWSILGTKLNSCNRGESLECGSQEVSAFGGDNESDTGDHWMVYCKTKYWQKNDSIRLKHVDTDTWLSLSGKTYGRPIYGQMEVICALNSDSASYWKTVEGVFVQPTGKLNSATTDHDEL